MIEEVHDMEANAVIIGVEKTLSLWTSLSMFNLLANNSATQLLNSGSVTLILN